MSAFSLHKSSSGTALMVQALDFLGVCSGGWISYQMRFGEFPEFAELPVAEFNLILGLAVFSSFLFSKAYSMWPGGSLAAMVGRVTVGWIAAWVLLIVLIVSIKSAESFSRIWLFSWLLTGAFMLWLGRFIAFFIMAYMRKAGHFHKKVLVYGDNKMLEMVRNRLQEATWSGYDIVSTVLQGNSAAVAAKDAELRPDEIWISLNVDDQKQLDEVLYALRHSVANIRLLPDLMMYKILNHGMSITVGIPMVDISVSPMYGMRRVIKLGLDYAVASFALLIFSPLLIAIALAIKFTSKGPVLFKQKRHGWNNEEIWVYKFRSMAMHQETHGEVTQAKREDPRVTPLGKFLRKSSLDELPQFINVLQGRMSVVGPRPHALKHNSDFMKLIPHYALRHKVKPGITGWAQICGFRGETDTLDKMEGRIKHDLYYLEHWSLWMDLKIIFMTPLATIQNKNVY
jgi:putative colanic acid biosynthesis UDP-glucose lipid carrier transferase